MADKAAAQCPDSQLVLSGYSQGAQLVHNGAAQMKPETAAHVKAVVRCMPLAQLWHTCFPPPPTNARKSSFRTASTKTGDPQVLFGDPFEGRALPNISQDIVETFCFATDLICENTIIVAPSHLSYSIDALPAAQFVAGKCSW